MTRGRFEDLTGRRFGRLTVLERASNRGRHVYWTCKCDCGTVKEIRPDGLRNGRVVSCGCYQHDVVTKHGMWQSAAHGVWNGMIQRCENPNHHAYSLYGGRGIKVCERWHDFGAFYADMYPKPSRRHSIDRIDNDGDYEPSNCRWATDKQQGRNRSDNRIISYNGEERCLSEWADKIGMNWTTLWNRLKRGWSVVEAMETPVDLGNRWKRQATAPSEG